MTRLQIRLLATTAAAMALAGCSSSGSAGSAQPPTQAPPTVSSTPPPASPLPTVPGETLTLPQVTESFTVLPCPHHPQTTLDIEGCAEHQIVRLDQRINDAAKALYDAMPAHAQSDFASAQQAWVAYRRAECLSESDANAGGSLAAVTFANCEVRLDRQRASDLATLRAQSSS
jgi:uncharacterized protein YecT (DUF1311 family)